MLVELIYIIKICLRYTQHSFEKAILRKAMSKSGSRYCEYEYRVDDLSTPSRKA